MSNTQTQVLLFRLPFPEREDWKLSQQSEIVFVTPNSLQEEEVSHYVQAGDVLEELDHFEYAASMISSLFLVVTINEGLEVKTIRAATAEESALASSGKNPFPTAELFWDSLFVGEELPKGRFTYKNTIIRTSNGVAHWDGDATAKEVYAFARGIIAACKEEELV